MSRRTIRYMIIAAGVLLVSLGGAFLASKYRLHMYRVYIESHYQTQLTLIEKEMQASRQPNVNDTFESVQAREKVRDRIEDALAGPEFFNAWWSLDGHHGMDTLKMMPAGYSEYPIHDLVHSGERYHSHSSYFGSAKDGTKLIIFEGWVESPWNRQYTITFRRSELDSRMQSKEGGQPNGAANRSQPVRSETNRTSVAAGSGR